MEIEVSNKTIVLQIITFEMITFPPITQTDTIFIYDGNLENENKLFDNVIGITGSLFNTTG